LRISKPEVDLPAGIDPYSKKVYARGKENFQKFLRFGILVQDDRDNFYIYKQVWGHHVQIGLVAGASVDDYQKDIIKKHELTRPDKEEDRMRHIETLNAQSGPVFLAYKNRDSILELLQRGRSKEPVYDFTGPDGVRHILYVVNDDKLIEALKIEFSQVNFLYVADGHHRSAAASRIKDKRQQENPHHTGNEEYNFFLAVIFPHDQLNILPYNRVVRDLNNLSEQDFFLRLSEKFFCEELGKKKPEMYGEFCMYLSGKWYRLKAIPGTYDTQDPIRSLDVSVLQDNLLGPILGIDNPRTDKRINFVGGIRGAAELERLVDQEGYKVAFSLYPTTIEQLFKVADTGKTMPPKSTWFEPKLKDGLVTHALWE